MENKEARLRNYIEQMLELMDHDAQLRTLQRIATSGRDGTEKDNVIARSACSVMAAMILLRRDN